MIFDSLNIAASSLQTQQKSINVVSHNIANANTAGYSRQVADIATLTPESVGGLSLGRGVNVTGISRIVDPMINSALSNNGSQMNYWTTQNTGLNSVANVFGSLQNTGLASALDNFFLSWQQLANNPQDSAQQFNVRTKGETLITNLGSMSQQLSAAQSSADGQIDSQIQQANKLIDTIAALSTQIRKQENALSSSAGTANDLRDQRDQAVRSLANLLPVQQISDNNGGLLLQTASGDLLTQDGVARHLARGTAIGGGFAGLVIAQTGQAVNIGQSGSIGGLIDLRDNKLGGYMSQINSLAANLAFSVNQIHASAASATTDTTMTAGQPSNVALALNDPAQSAAFANQIVSGSFKIHVYNATGTATPAGGTAINITAGTTTMADVITSLNAVTGISASMDAGSRLNITAATGSSFALSNDTSNTLAAYEVNSYFTGSSAATLNLSTSIQASPAAIHTGRVDPLTSTISSSDNSAAIAIMQLQNQAVSFDGSLSSSLHNRTTAVSTQYGNDVATSLQQRQYRTAEADSLNAQRQAISGVNTDEELVSMIKFQRAYEASAKIITTTNQMMDSLLGLIR
ncbi:flagellar hook-associated protein FlgK [Mariprofundus ferrooxydans]|uniref:Flagellar hook-associated protein 1 n=1 Tax=Mariprofundus ferrooxydans PV-1 TaxID=314345 RepID=Q0EYE1_9PROT|nr:flagellar hook-associated protein FlgK [Mariprofundus ferrooxydans]EAU54251.1 probable flagellar hook-associated protein [Mariprofundus ferrooxydans PV-1]KON47798.1 flagellar hook protein [Mariprofundus ferrooxydans]